MNKKGLKEVSKYGRAVLVVAIRSKGARENCQHRPWEPISLSIHTSTPTEMDGMENIYALHIQYIP
jgi:hypothetical protein